MKRIWWLILATICAAGLVSCDDDDDDKDRSYAISGPAILRVLNQVRYTQQISFDGTYIGDVAANSSRDWNVPTGTHVVSGYDSVYGAASSTLKFYANQVTTYRIYLRSARAAADADAPAKAGAAADAGE
jgi:hypothetical protein